MSAFGAAFYTLFVWMPTYLMSFVKPPIDNAFLINTLAIALMLVLMLPAGRLTDRIGYKTVIAAEHPGTGDRGLSLVPLDRHRLAHRGDRGDGRIRVLVVWTSSRRSSGDGRVVPADDWPYSGTAIGYNLALALFGGTAPLVATWLIARTGNLAAPAWYLTILSAMSLLCVLAIRPHPEGCN